MYVTWHQYNIIPVSKRVFILLENNMRRIRSSEGGKRITHNGICFKMYAQCTHYILFLYTYMYTFLCTHLYLYTLLIRLRDNLLTFRTVENKIYKMTKPAI